MRLTTLVWLLGGASALSAQSVPPPLPAPPLVVPAQPIGRWTPVPELPGMGRAVDTATVAARRRALARAIRSGIVLIPAAHERSIERDHAQDSDFRQSNTFFYFTQLETHDAWLVLTVAADTGHTTLFLEPRDTSEERWTGIQLGPDSVAASLSGIPDIVTGDSLAERFSALAAAKGGGPVFLPLDDATADEQRNVQAAFAGQEVRDLGPVADSLRLVKDAGELKRLQTAIDITVQGLKAVMRAARPGMWEYQLEAVLEGTFRANGADRVGFPSFVGSGPNGTTLHYDANRRQTRAGELVAVDAGAEWGQYTADVTRTFPVSGRFTARQKAVYDLVLATQRAAFDSVRPGVRLRDIDALARRYMKQHSGKLCGKLSCDVYFVHGLSHWLGMDVHDPGDVGAPFAPGMVLTIEPGIYLPAESLGIRIEDDVVVTATGAAWLTDGAPRTTEAIEQLMSCPSCP
ncbi:MAG TPA: aminopeptidase P family protein [Gemmatimonadales bacterium]|nr:aminopeptidase P family protein [Gemmatimonadales bacterium]